jgi:hypothetical protein
VTIRVTDDGTPALDDFENITITVIATNEAPTLTNVAALTGANEDVPLTITYAALAAAAHENDVDGPKTARRLRQE